MSIHVNERMAASSVETAPVLPVAPLAPGTADSCRNSRTKRFIDIVASASGLVLLSPILALLMGLIFLQDRGPVFFRQKRTGLDGEVFHIWKLRSMSVPPKPTPFRQTRGPHDPRITPLGRWLRATSLDELPQLVNVLAGEMSLVGPRPHPVELDAFYKPRFEAYMQRYSVRPGLTGNAQVSGARGPIDSREDMRNRLQHDLDYIRDWSVWLDVRLIFRTVLFPSKGH